MYGNRFATMWAGVDPAMVKETWSEALAGFSADEIATGLRACMGNDWPPTLPEFLKACRRPPDYEAMFIAAANGRFESDVAYWAAQSFGFFEIRNTPWASAKARWIRCVDTTREFADLPERPEHRRRALPAPGQTVSPEKARAAVDEINAMLKRRPLPQVDDGEGDEVPA